MTISPVSSMIVRMHYLFFIGSILICLSVVFVMKVGLDFTPRFTSKEEDKDVQREVFSRQVNNPFRLEISFHIYHFTILCQPLDCILTLSNGWLFAINLKLR